MNDDELTQALRALPPDLPAPYDRFEQVQERVSKRREKAVGIPLLAAGLVVALAFVMGSLDGKAAEVSSAAGTRTSSFWDRLWNRGDQAASEPRAEDVECPKVDTDLPHQNWVPEPPEKFDGPGLLPAETPRSVVVCSYQRRQADARTSIDGGLQALTDQLSWIPPYAPGGQRGVCTAMGMSAPASFLLRLEYAGGATVWLSTQEDPNHCVDTYNGREAAPAYIGDQVAEAVRTGTWPAAPVRDPQPPNPCPAEDARFGRLGQEKQMVPPGAVGVSVCHLLRDGGETRKIPDPAAAEELTRRMNAPARRPAESSIDLVRGRTTRVFQVTFDYPEGPSVSIVLDPNQRPGMRGTHWTANDADEATAYAAALFDAAR